jgi:ABC-type polysaccharide/polyol phosphate export permease
LPILLLVLCGMLVVGLIAALIGALIPAIPFLLLGLLLWAIFRQRPATA